MSDIELDSITKRFDDIVALDSVSLTVEDGELLVLVGPSGCGKTTLLRIVAGLEHPTTGDVSIDGEVVTSLPARKREVGLVFQDFALFPHLDVRENLSFNLRMRGETDDLAGRITAIAELLGIEELLDRRIDELSGGQKQRVALGRAIAGEPRAFLLDEPFANLDAGLRNRMQTEIARLQDRLGVTTIHVTHDQREAITMGDRIAVMEEGRIRQVGPPEEVYRTPADLFVARFIGNPAMNLIDGRTTEDGRRIAFPETDSRWSVAANGLVGLDEEVVVGVRPEHVIVTTDGLEAGDGLAADVSFVEYTGSDQLVYLEPAGLPELVARVDVGRPLDDGQSVRVTFDPDNVHVFDPRTGDRYQSET